MHIHVMKVTGPVEPHSPVVRKAVFPQHRWDGSKGIYDVVDKVTCPVCLFTTDKLKDVPRLNDSTLRCKQCGRISIGYHMMDGSHFKPTAMMRQLVHSAAPILRHLGAGSCDDTWETIVLCSNRSFLVRRAMHGGYLDLDFACTYASDCQAAEKAKAGASNRAGFPWTLQEWRDKTGGRRLPPKLEGVFQALVENEWRAWGLYDHGWGRAHLIKGENRGHATHGVRLYMTWRNVDRLAS